jgi:histidinol-phosphate aminotransferase
MAQAAALAALDDQDHVQTARALNLKERNRLTETLTARGLTVAPSQANFVLVDVKRPARPVYDAFRVTIGTERENDRFLAALSEVLA